MKHLLLSIVAVLIFVPTSSGIDSSDISKQTHQYAVKDGNYLYLDKYDVEGYVGHRPCVIFMFGGGFFSGQRDAKGYLPYFEFLVREGYTVISIDYRLGFREFAQKLRYTTGASAFSPSSAEFLEVFSNTLNMAVEDLFDASSYVVSHAEEWGIDRNTIIASGSSAGAVTSLMAEYAICNAHESTALLPDGFRYAGIISFAGAIFTKGDLDFQTKPCPVMMFHGDADSNVPYDKVTALGLGFYGSKHIAGVMREARLPYWFLSYENADHQIAGTPLAQNHEEVLSFLNKLVMQNRPLMIESHIRDLEKPEVDKHFNLIDYVRKNFAPLAGR